MLVERHNIGFSSIQRFLTLLVFANIVSFNQHWINKNNSSHIPPSVSVSPNEKQDKNFPYRLVSHQPKIKTQSKVKYLPTKCILYWLVRHQSIERKNSLFFMRMIVYQIVNLLNLFATALVPQWFPIISWHN